MCESRERSVSATAHSLCGCRVIGAFHLSSRQRSVQTKTERSAAKNGGVQTTVVGKTANQRDRTPPGRPRSTSSPHGPRRAAVCAGAKSKMKKRNSRRFSFHSRFTITGVHVTSLTYGALRVASGFSLYVKAVRDPHGRAPIFSSRHERESRDKGPRAGHAIWRSMITCRPRPRTRCGIADPMWPARGTLGSLSGGGAAVSLWRRRHEPRANAAARAPVPAAASMQSMAPRPVLQRPSRATESKTHFE